MAQTGGTKLELGATAESSKTIGEHDVYTFAELTGDFNPVHVDEVAAGRSRFGTRVAHGMLAAGLFSAILGTKLPGPGTIYLGQELRFVAPVRFGDTVTARVELLEVRTDKPIAVLRTWAVNQKGETVLDGKATVLLPG
ncbi:MAG: MaoC family dehydratase [Deltaproteobacteria bacterium]|nr:MaoC family dehydratase [Deltaproteobacteria bacterium]